MKSFFRFTAGEWTASTFIALLIIGGVIFYFVYENKATANNDYHEFETQVRAFEAEQQRLADSVALARQKYGKHWPNNCYSSDTNRNHGKYPKAFSDDSLRKISKKEQYDIVKVELNAADTNDITCIPQFGSKRAWKIVEYRTQLGGFYSVSQLKEIYILQNINLDYAQKYFYVDRKKIHKININTCDYKTLASHPYFDSYLAKTILNYRRQHGKINNMKELVEITHIYSELEDKICWYVEF